MIFCLGTEQGLAATHANVCPLRFRIRELTAEGRFSSLLARDVVLLVSKFGLPLGIWFLDFVAHGLFYTGSLAGSRLETPNASHSTEGQKRSIIRAKRNEINRATLFGRRHRRHEGGGRPRDFARRNS